MSSSFISDDWKARAEGSLLGLLALLVFLNGGKGTWGLALFFAGSFALFLWAWKTGPLLRPPRRIEAALGAMACVVLAGAAESFWVRKRGFLHLTHFTVQAAHFYLLYSLWSESLERRFLKFLFWAATIFGAGTLLQPALGIDRGHLWLSLPNENLLGAFFNVGIVSGAVLLFEKYGERSRAERIGWGGGLLILLGAQFYVFSRGALLSLAAVAILGSLRRAKIAFWAFSSLLAIFLATGLLFPETLRYPAKKLWSARTNARFVVWKSAWNGWKEKPWLGWGLGGFQDMYKLHQEPLESEVGRFDRTTRFAHNEFLDLAVQCGAAGILAFLAFLAALWIPGNGLPRTAPVFGVLLLHSAVDFVFHLPLLLFIFTFSCVGIARGRGEGLPLPRRAPRWLLLAARCFWGAGIGAALIALAADGIHRRSVTLRSRGDIGAADRLLILSARLNPFSLPYIVESTERLPPEEKEARLLGALRLHPQEDVLEVHLARQERRLGKAREALRHYSSAIQKKPKHPFYYLELGDFLTELGQREPALELYRAAAHLEPFYVLAHLRIASLERMRGNPEAARLALANADKIRSMRLPGETEYARRLLEDPRFPAAP